MVTPQPKYMVAAKWIRESIKSASPSDRIPGERSLAKSLGMSYMTIRKAIDVLVEEGTLYREPTKGTFVANNKNKTRKKTKNIGYFLDSSIKDGLTSPYYSLIFNALEKEASEYGYSIVYFSDINEVNASKKMKKIDGLIVSCFPRIEHIVQYLKLLVPQVVIDNASFDKSIPSIIIDNFNAVADSITHLGELGHKRIGFITGLDDSEVGSNRLAGYNSALNKLGIKEDLKLIFRGDYTFETGMAAAEHLLKVKNPPTAIMCANDSMAIGAIKQANKMAISVPDDLSIIGFDDITVASQITPPLTTVSAPIASIVKHAIKMLHQQIRGEALQTQHIALPGTLKVRNTCGAIATNS